MLTVYKYTLEAQDLTEVVLPKGAKLLTAQVQRGVLCLWALIDTEQKEAYTQRFRVAGTGHDLKGIDWTYLSTFFVYDGSLVFHVFYEPCS